MRYAALMINQELTVLSLNNFEGPLDLLWHLIQKNEIDIHQIFLKEVTTQYINQLKDSSNHNIDDGAEFIGTVGSLLLMKSKMLIPKHEQQEPTLGEDELDPRFEIIHKLIDYCRFKDIARLLAERELKQAGIYTRGVESLKEPQKGLGIEHLSLNDLATLFQEVLVKAVSHKGVIHGEAWSVSDKIKLIRKLFAGHQKIGFSVLFSVEYCREELIVSFLAVLELMKLGEILIAREEGFQEIVIMRRIHD